MPLFYFCLLLLTIIAEGRNPGYSSNDLQTIPNILSDLLVLCRVQMLQFVLVQRMSNRKTLSQMIKTTRQTLDSDDYFWFND
jgi:hypothetical protein